MYEGRLRARKARPTSEDRPLGTITNRKRERPSAKRYDGDAPRNSTPEMLARVLRRATAADRSWLFESLRRADEDAGGAARDGGRVVRADGSWSRRRSARVAALCERLGLKGITASSRDGAAGVAGIPYHADRGVVGKLRDAMAALASGPGGLGGDGASDQSDDTERDTPPRPLVLARTESPSGAADSPPPPPPPLHRGNALARCDSLVDRMAGGLQLTSSLGSRSSSFSTVDAQPEDRPRPTSLDEGSALRRAETLMTPGRYDARARSWDSAQVAAAPATRAPDFRMLSFDSAATSRAAPDSQRGSDLFSATRFSLGTAATTASRGVDDRRDSRRMSCASDWTLAAAPPGRGAFGGRPSDASDAGRRDSRPAGRRPRLPLFPSFSEFDDDGKAEDRGDAAADAKASPRPERGAKGLPSETPGAPRREGRATAPPRSHPSTAGSASSGGRRSFTPQHPPAAGRLSAGEPASCVATPQHPSAMPAGHAARGGGGARRNCAAWGSHPEFGDWGVSEPASPDRIARLRAQLDVELARQAEFYAKLDDDAKASSSVTY